MDDHLSTTQVGWLLGRSSSAVREMIGDGEIEAMRIPAGFRVPRQEVLRISRETIQEKAGRKLSDAELERLIDEVLATNETKTNEPVRLVKPSRARKRARPRDE
jgi:phenylalanyl-tRNA synthetase beta subunit